MILEDVRKLAAENRDNLLRVCINSIGSPVWYSDSFCDDVLKFLVELKSITRYSENIVCFLTMPLHLINLVDDQLIYKIRKLVDVSVNLESFDDVEKQTNAVFKQYHGLLHIKKLQTLTALQSHKPEAFDLAFKLKSHKFLIEKLHLPPELQDNDQSKAPSCSTTGGGNKALDFWRKRRNKEIFTRTSESLIRDQWCVQRNKSDKNNFIQFWIWCQSILGDVVNIKEEKSNNFTRKCHKSLNHSKVLTFSSDYQIAGIVQSILSIFSAAQPTDFDTSTIPISFQVSTFIWSARILE